MPYEIPGNTILVFCKITKYRKYKTRSTITDNNKPAYGSLQNTSTNWGVSIVTRINVTKAVKSSYGSGEMISLATYTTGTHDNSNHCTNGVSKEGAYENRHGLNITYSNAPSGGGGGSGCVLPGGKRNQWAEINPDEKAEFVVNDDDFGISLY